MKKLATIPPIYIGKRILRDIKTILPFDRYSKIVIITDTVLEKLLLNQILNVFPAKPASIIIPSGEKEKNIRTVQKIWNELLQLGCDRKSLVINLGGGVIGDMGGFAASTYMRGIDFAQIPTTLLAQVDASVGGKTGINFAEIKNLIGTFAQPITVIIDTIVLETLPKREFIEGFGEIVKHGLIKDKKYFHFVTAKDPREFTDTELVTIIEKSCRIKWDIIKSDMSEKGKRKLVNFGHTIGHAVEAAALETSSPLLHGEAVSVGMVAEAKLSELLGNITEEAVLEIKQSLEKIGLPTKTDIPEYILLKKMTADKKKAFGKIKWTLLKKIGEGMYDIEVPENTVKEALLYICHCEE